MTTRLPLLAALLLSFGCVDVDDAENRDAELVDDEDLVTEVVDASEDATRVAVVADEDPRCDADLTQVDPGEYNEYFVVVSPQQLELDPELDFTVDPDGTTLHADNGSGGIQMTCRCEDSCSGGASACLVQADASNASCTGSCNKSDGSACGVCGWHYGDTPAPRQPAGPRAPRPALPGAGQNALP